MNPDRDWIQEYHHGLAGFKVIFMEACKGTKRTWKGWDYYDALHESRGRSRIDLVGGWFNKGGVMFRPASGLWVLDCDDLASVSLAERFLESRGLECPRVLTPSGGLHLYLQFPSGFNRGGLKNHVVRAGRKAWDFKLGERTAIMVPGTETEKGPYLPFCPWVTPPRVDPREFESSLEPWKEEMPFLPCPDSPRRSRFAARGYLRQRTTKPSVCGEGGRLALMEVGCNLIRYYSLSLRDAHALLTRLDPDGQNWNQRCRWPDGRPY